MKTLSPTPTLRSGATKRLVLTLLCSLLALISPASAFLINHEGNPALAAAMAAEEVFHNHPTLDGRDEVERLYQEYLATSTDPLRRVPVLVRLGFLFSYANREYPEVLPDPSRARDYYQQAVDADPEGVSQDLLNARYQVAWRAGTARQRYDHLLGSYEFYSRADGDYIREHLRLPSPDYPGDAYFDNAVLQEGYAEQSIRDALIAGATALPEPRVRLADLASRFPDDPIAKAAREAIGKLDDAESLARTKSGQPIFPPRIITTPSGQEERASFDPAIRPTKPAKSTATVASPSTGWSRAWYAALAAVFMVTLVAVGLYLYARRRTQRGRFHGGSRDR